MKKSIKRQLESAYAKRMNVLGKGKGQKNEEELRTREEAVHGRTLQQLNSSPPSSSPSFDEIWNDSGSRSTDCTIRADNLDPSTARGFTTMD
ncbi:hypothetical protein SAY87_011611 [Trapa incisa]|uniref:Uncharacterized protein n=1 Tax=Trapa incisa TaxID=236973 RepID=A0AAN7JIF0_9MYRT|nr:hypothetical protein SAY87_011611 [Trapa incisa]